MESYTYKTSTWRFGEFLLPTDTDVDRLMELEDNIYRSGIMARTSLFLFFEVDGSSRTATSKSDVQLLASKEA